MQGEAVATPGTTVPPPQATPLPPTVPGKSVAKSGFLKTGPKAFKLPYSEQALAQLGGSPDNSPAPAPAATTLSELPSGDDADTESEWAWPASGKVLARFGDGTKGLVIGGNVGQPIFAAASGRVMYTGNGIRGYGNLIIIKHNAVYLSAYAHNSQILMKEGQRVVKGQKIAEMGDSDADRAKLHFEIRRYGKPVDPLKFLSATGNT
ncbi:MAG: peptidoglycan DD-metalloendopeptidase family protein, partial [Burkholderiales bacterium]